MTTGADGVGFISIAVWHWLIVGVVLVILEMLTPGVVFLWLGIAAFATAAVMLLAGAVSGVDLDTIFTRGHLGWEVQLLAFAVFAVVSTVVGRRWFRRHAVISDRPNLNLRARQYLGRRFTLDQPIVNGVGRVRVGDSMWRVIGDDLPAGTLVEVRDVDGATLVVAAAGEPVGAGPAGASGSDG